MTLDEIVRYFETLTTESLATLDTIYREDAHFKDPFNELAGINAIRRVYAHMFARLETPRFVVTSVFSGADGAVLLWDFSFGTLPAARPIRGASHLRFAPDGRIRAHRDYWDPAEELYERIPVLGGLMRFVRRRFRAR